jgi:hypothetical protein
MYRFMKVFTLFFAMGGEAPKWGTFPRSGAGLSHQLVFESPYLGALLWPNNLGR